QGWQSLRDSQRWRPSRLRRRCRVQDQTLRLVPASHRATGLAGVISALALNRPEPVCAIFVSSSKRAATTSRLRQVSSGSVWFVSYLKRLVLLSVAKHPYDHNALATIGIPHSVRNDSSSLKLSH